MKYHYSASKNSFFPESLRGSFGIDWPADAVPVSADTVALYTGEPVEGYALGPNASGLPCWVPSDVPGGLSLAQHASLMNAWVWSFLDTTAVEYGYDSILSAVSWAGDPDPQYAKDGDAFKAWRSQVYKVALPFITAVGSGSNPIMTKTDFVGQLPSFAPPRGVKPFSY